MVSSPAAKLRSQIMTARNHGELPKLPLSDLPPHHALFDQHPHHAASSPQGGSSSSSQEGGRVGTGVDAGNPKKGRRRKRNRKKQVAAQSGAGGAGIAGIVAPKAEAATPDDTGAAPWLKRSDLQPHHAASSPQGGPSSSATASVPAQENGSLDTGADAGNPKKGRRRKRNRRAQVAAQSEAGGPGIAEIAAPKAGAATPEEFDDTGAPLSVGRGESLAIGTPRPPSEPSLEDRLNSAECFEGAWLLMRDSMLTTKGIAELSQQQHQDGHDALDVKATKLLAAHNLQVVEDLVTQSNMCAQEQCANPDGPTTKSAEGSTLPEEIRKLILSYIPKTSFVDFEKTAFLIREGARQSRRFFTLSWFVNDFSKSHCIEALREGFSGMFLSDHIALGGDIHRFPWSKFDAEVGFSVFFQTTTIHGLSSRVRRNP